MEHSFLTKNAYPVTLQAHYTKVTPSIKFIKTYLPNVELANKKSKDDLLPKVV